MQECLASQEHYAAHRVCESLCTCSARERVVGWYSTGPRLREADLDINDLVSNYCDNPLLVICEVQASDPNTLFSWSLCMICSR